MSKMQPVPGDFLASLRAKHPGKTGADVAAAVAEFFETYPQRWQQGRYANDAEGARVAPTDPNAATFCAVGAAGAIYGENPVSFSHPAITRLRDHFYAVTNYDYGPVSFNDSALNVSDVIAKFRELSNA